MKNDPTKEDMLEHTNRCGLCGEPDDMFDVEAAIYWFASDWHGGQASNLYSALSTSPYKPSPLHYTVADAGETALEIYDCLVSEFTH